MSKNESYDQEILAAGLNGTEVARQVYHFRYILDPKPVSTTELPGIRNLSADYAVNAPLAWFVISIRSRSHGWISNLQRTCRFGKDMAICTADTVMHKRTSAPRGCALHGSNALRKQVYSPTGEAGRPLVAVPPVAALSFGGYQDSNQTKTRARSITEDTVLAVMWQFGLMP